MVKTKEEEMNNILKSSEQWEKDFPGLIILDPDGWDRSSCENFSNSWLEPITKQEFINRLVKSTINFPTNLVDKI